MADDRFTRLLALTEAAAKIADPSNRLGQLAREQLPSKAGLSQAGVDYALTHCLEWKTGRGALSSLVRKTSRVPVSHVLLSSNIFVGAFRAIALGLMQSPRVVVRPSRRDPTMTQLLHEASGGVFELADSLEPAPGHDFWAYGSDETLQTLRETLPPGLNFHGHGSGMGAAIFRERGHDRAALPGAIEGLARDTIAFDQRGCLSPRCVLIEGSREFGETVADLLVAALDRWEEKVPRGTLSEQEQIDRLRHESAMIFMGSSVRAGQGMVTLDPVEGRILLPPTGRYLHLTLVQNAVEALDPFADKLTSVGLFNPGHLPGTLLERIGERRYVELGQMQRPPLDGPVDLRSGWAKQTL